MNNYGGVKRPNKKKYFFVIVRTIKDSFEEIKELVKRERERERERESKTQQRK